MLQKNSANPGNFEYQLSSNPMSSLSGAHYDEELPTDRPSAPVAGEAPGAALLRRAQSGDRAAYGLLIVAYQDRLYNAVLRLVGDAEEAGDLTQETFTRGLMNIHSFRGDAQPYTWLFRIAVNLAISSLRRVKRRRTFSLDGAGSHTGGGGSGGNGRARSDSNDQAAGLMDRVTQSAVPGPLMTLEKRERDQQVLAALGRVDAEYRAVLVMRDIEGFDYQQMAEVLELPLGTLKSRLFRARLALRDELKPYLSDGRKK